MILFRYITSIYKFIFSKKYRFLKLEQLGVYNSVSDKEYLEKRYKITVGKDLNLSNPQTFSEKLQWLKLYDRKPEYIKMVDKYEVKQYVAEKIGAEYIIPTLGVWDKFEEIDFSKLPNQFVLKCTHDSGGLVICKDKSTLKFQEAKKKLNASLKRNYFYYGREWPYKNVKPRIIAEKYIEDNTKDDLNDYKFFCFDGVVKLVMITYGRGTNQGLHISYYDTDLTLLEMWHHKYPRYEGEIVRPQNYDELLRIAGELSKGIPHVRVDLYEVNGKIYFGEMTFFNASGFGVFRPEKWDYELGSWLKLTK